MVEQCESDGVASEDYFSFPTLENLAAMIGDPAFLVTDTKANTVAAINELYSKIYQNAHRLWQTNLDAWMLAETLVHVSRNNPSVSFVDPANNTPFDVPVWAGDYTISADGCIIEVESVLYLDNNSVELTYGAPSTIWPLKNIIGTKALLDTDDKSTIVAAINEVLRKAQISSIPIAAAYKDSDSGWYYASGADLPEVHKASVDPYRRPVGKGTQIIFIPYGQNEEGATLVINDGEWVPIKMRSMHNKGSDQMKPDATVNIPAGCLLSGVPYTMTFCGKYWLIDSYISGGSDGTVGGDINMAGHALYLDDDNYIFAQEGKLYLVSEGGSPICIMDGEIRGILSVTEPDSAANKQYVDGAVKPLVETLIEVSCDPTTGAWSTTATADDLNSASSFHHVFAIQVSGNSSSRTRRVFAPLSSTYNSRSRKFTYATFIGYNGEKIVILKFTLDDNDEYVVNEVDVSGGADSRRVTINLTLRHDAWTTNGESHTQTVNVSELEDVDEDEDVLLQCCPAPQSINAWSTYGVQCMEATAGAMTFRAATHPAENEDIGVVVAMWR